MKTSVRDCIEFVALTVGIFAALLWMGAFHA